jgi:SNF2 family DNA or RNA helicase
MEQGTGKTLTAIAIAGRAFLNNKIKRLLVVCPNSVVPVWPKELEAYAGFPYEVHALTGASVKKKAEGLGKWRPGKHLQVAVVNYESVWRMEEELRAWSPDMIIADESQRIKTPGTRQSKGMHKLGQVARYRLILTGTPVSNGPLEFWSQYRFLDPTIFQPSYYAFRNRYAIMGGFQRHQVVGYQNLPELVQKAHSIAFRVTKAEALDLPESIDQYLYCSMDKQAQGLYNQMVKESVAELSEETTIVAINVLSRLLRLSQFAGGYYRDEEGKLHEVSNAKMNLFKETLDDLMGAGKKVVVFARFLPEIGAIVEHLKKSKIGYALITGAVPTDERGEEVDRFQNDPDCRVFIAQEATAGLGITLTAADTAIFYSLDYSYANYDQCRARIHRISQESKCTFIHLVTENTVDEVIIKALAEKENLASSVVDRWRDLLK